MGRQRSPRPLPLSPRMAMVLRLHLDGLRQCDVARKMNISRTRVRQLLVQALERTVRARQAVALDPRFELEYRPCGHGGPVDGEVG